MASSLSLQNEMELTERLARIWAEVRYWSERCGLRQSFMD
jgi:hypothetical protein